MLAISQSDGSPMMPATLFFSSKEIWRRNISSLSCLAVSSGLPWIILAPEPGK